MHELINKLAFSLFKKNSLEECKVEEIEELVKQYPFFSSAQLLLAAKQKQTGNENFQKQLTTTSLHVTNPFWLDHLLSSQPLKEATVAEENLAATEVNNEPNNDELVLERNRREFVVPSNQDLETKDVSKEEVVEIPDPPPPPAPVVEKKEATTESKLVFEPYYTVDYFASQGIKNVIEEKPKDRFSQQLKSFTEWLKAIRQMPQQEIAALSDSKSEEKVVQLATHSLDEENVDTEAMAEVWVKQGHPEKAIRIYEKLSLLNPPKSSYFASLIENLKKS